MNEYPNSDDSAAYAVIFKQRLGILLCVIYAVAYTGFVAISIHDVTLMDTAMPFGLNLATFYGLGLIILALFLAMIYSIACTTKEFYLAKKSGKLDGAGAK